MADKHYFNTRQLLIIALFGCLGAVLSTHVGYLAGALGAMTGLPAGGQLFTGLHVLWIILVLALVHKKGAGLMTALFNNVLQFLLGSHLGILVLPIGILQGVCAELAYWPLHRISRPAALMAAGAISSWSNIWIHQLAFNRFGNLYLFAIVSLFAVVSGIVFGGGLSVFLHRVLRKTGFLTEGGRPEAAVRRRENPVA